MAPKDVDDGEDGPVKSVHMAPEVNEEATKRDEMRKGPSKRLSKKQSSFFARMGKSFRKSDGQRGASVETLRGINGADFEGNATILRGGAGDAGACGCFGTSSKPQELLILIKGPFCFVYESQDTPKYAISLAHMKAVVKDPTIVVLETSLGDVEYELEFEQSSQAKQFAAAAAEQASVGEADIVRKRLGHERLLTKKASVRYAESVALKKIQDQPTKNNALDVKDYESGVVMAGGMVP